MDAEIKQQMDAINDESYTMHNELLTATNNGFRSLGDSINSGFQALNSVLINNPRNPAMYTTPAGSNYYSSNSSSSSSRINNNMPLIGESSGSNVANNNNNNSYK